MQTLFQFLLPQHCLSRFAGWVAQCEQPWIKNRLIKNFIKEYQVDMSLAVKESPNEYRNFNEFFTRALKPEKRPIASQAGSIVSPVDGFISQLGNIHQGQLIQAKNVVYNLQTLLGGSKELASQFQQGKFATFYLSPKDYHRVHIPYAGKLREMIYVPGRLFSVNPRTTSQLPQLFVRNERVITLFTTSVGPMAIILVGAMLVANISTVWEGNIAPNALRQIRHWHYTENAVSLCKGEELGRFQLGSTVIILFPAHSIRWSEWLAPDKKVQFGECIGHMQ
ncbi:MAG: archaetidylserine decarboxylase [Rickettsiella sp.]|nr:archaetidylserine decarboxylase [Rickettsiella sp.]